MFILTILGLILLIIFTIDLRDDHWSVFGQTLVNATQTPVLSQNLLPGGTPTVPVAQQIATTDDLSQQFNQTMAALIATGGTVSAGVGAVWSKMRGKAKKIDFALRGNDFDQRDLMEVLNSFFEAAKRDKTKTPGQILDDMAYKDKVLLEKNIGTAWAQEYDEYMEWFEQRYTVNPN